MAGLGFWKFHGEINGIRAKLNKAFLHFLPTFWHIWWFFKVEHALHLAKIRFRVSNLSLIMYSIKLFLKNLKEKSYTTYANVNHFDNNTLNCKYPLISKCLLLYLINGQKRASTKCLPNLVSGFKKNQAALCQN